ncbi:MAG: recombinase family protein [Pseudomonadota bacterium]
MRMAYARVSSADQSLALQRDALARAGYDELFEDHGVSGVAAKRPGLEAALECLQPGDTLVVWRLDRLARSMRELVDIVDDLNHRKIGFLSICEHIDTSSAVGELILHVLSAIAHFERRLIQERTIAGIKAAKERGVVFGRQPVLEESEIKKAKAMIANGEAVANVARSLQVGRSTLYRYLKSQSG